MARTATKNGGSSRFQLLPQTLLKQWRTYLRLTLGSPSCRFNFLGFLLLICCVVLGTSAISQDKPRLLQRIRPPLKLLSILGIRSTSRPEKNPIPSRQLILSTPR